MLKVIINYPKKEEEKLIIRQNISGERPEIKPILTKEEILDARNVVREVYLDEKIERYIVDMSSLPVSRLRLVCRTWRA